MLLPTATSNGPGVRLRVLGIPVRFDAWFFIIGVLINYSAGVEVVLLWLFILGGSVLVHELGHALVARTTGARPEIVIHALGGLTSWLPPTAVSRGRRVAISLAGPAAGISLGLVFWAARRAGVGAAGGLGARAISMGIVVNIFYGLLNLLPILPLDGGQTLRDLLPGDDARRERVAAIVSIVVGVAMAGVAMSYEIYFGAVFLALFVVMNIATLRG
ncbi:MAG: site-2 protease family protein, partial [Mycobacteriales bacterium]